jgi:hypothetical protein
MACAVENAFLTETKLFQLFEMLKHLGLSVHAERNCRSSDPEKIVLNLYFTDFQKETPTSA